MVLSLGHLDAGDLAWAQKECDDMFRGVADVIVGLFVQCQLILFCSQQENQLMDSPSRGHFLENLKPGGKYHGIIGLYRHNISADHIGIFDKEIIDALAPSVKCIAHNGAGYDQIDVIACKAKGSQSKHHALIPRIQTLTLFFL